MVLKENVLATKANLFSKWGLSIYVVVVVPECKFQYGITLVKKDPKSTAGLGISNSNGEVSERDAFLCCLPKKGVESS